MKISRLCLSSLSGAATLARIMLPTLYCRNEGCTPSGSLHGVDHVVKRSASTYILDATATNAIAKRNNKKLDVNQQTKESKGSTKQRALPPNPQGRLSPLAEEQPKTLPSVKSQATSAKSPSGKEGFKSNNPVRQQIKPSETNRGGGNTANVPTSKQSKLDSITGSRDLRSSNNPNAISSKSSPSGAVDLNHKQAKLSKMGLGRAAQPMADFVGFRGGTVFSGNRLQGQQMKIAGKAPSRKANGHKSGQQSGKRGTPSHSLLGKGKSMQSEATLGYVRSGNKADRGQPGSGRGPLSKVGSNRQSKPSQSLRGKKRLCRRGSNGNGCDPSELEKLSPPLQQSMGDHLTRKKMDQQLATQASLDLRKAKNSKNSNRLTTGILGTGLASSITSTSATMPGLCCHGMACGSAHLTCSAVATGSLGAAGICLGCIAVGLTAYKAVQDDRNAKEMESKLDHAYGEVQRQKEGQASTNKRISEERAGRETLAKEVGDERSGRAALAKEVGDAKTQIAETKEDVGKTQEKLSAIGNTANTALNRVDSTKKVVNDVNQKAEIALNQVDSTKRVVNDVNKKADTALNRVDSTKKVVNDVKTQAQAALERTKSLGKGVADAKNQVQQTKETLQDVKVVAEEARLDADRASSSYGELRRSHSDRLADQAKKIKELEAALKKAGIPTEMDPWMHNSPFY